MSLKKPAHFIEVAEFIAVKCFYYSFVILFMPVTSKMMSDFTFLILATCVFSYFIRLARCSSILLIFSKDQLSTSQLFALSYYFCFVLFLLLLLFSPCLFPFTSMSFAASCITYIVQFSVCLRGERNSGTVTPPQLEV